MKYFIALSIAVVLGAPAFAQQKGQHAFYANWSFGPTLNTKFVKQFSTSGANLGYNTFIKDNLAIGGELAWGNYQQYAPRQTYHTGDGAFTTDMYKTIFTLPLTATITKYFNAGSHLSPYAKLGLGASYSQEKLYYNVYETNISNWGFVTVPEIGVNIRLKARSPWAFNLSSQYKYSTNKEKRLDVSNIQTLHFNAGITWQIGAL